MTGQKVETVFDEIYHETSRKVLCYIKNKCGKTEDISDIFQDTYMELLVVLEKKGEDYIKNKDAFVMQIAKSKVYHYYLCKARVGTVFSSQDLEGVELAEVSQPLDEWMVQKEMVREVYKLLEAKDRITREIFYLYYQRGMSIPAISSVLGMGQSNVKNKLYRTIKSLRACVIQ